MIYISIIVIIIVLYLVIHTYLVRISRNEVKADVKKEFSFVHISDIHGSLRFINGSVSSIINKLSPNFVVVTGDLSNKQEQLPKVLDELGKIVTENGIFLVLGNYEGQEIHGFRKANTDIDMSINLIKENRSLTLLKNEHCLLNFDGNKVLLYGFDNSTYGKEHYEKSIDDIECDYKIILAHSPNIIKVIEQLAIACNQILVGHTHGGQINILKFNGLGKYKDFHTGVKSYKNILFCISRGLGTVKIPIRINCFPEISVYKIIPK